MNSEDKANLIQKIINSGKSPEDKEELKKEIDKQKLIPEILFLMGLIFVAYFLIFGF